MSAAGNLFKIQRIRDALADDTAMVGLEDDTGYVGRVDRIVEWGPTEVVFQVYKAGTGDTCGSILYFTSTIADIKIKMWEGTVYNMWGDLTVTSRCWKRSKEVPVHGK